MVLGRELRTLAAGGRPRRAAAAARLHEVGERQAEPPVVLGRDPVRAHQLGVEPRHDTLELFQRDRLVDDGAFRVLVARPVAIELPQA